MAMSKFKAILSGSELFGRRVCFVHARNFSTSNLGNGLLWTYIHPYQAVKIDLCDSVCLQRWAAEGADKEFEQCLACEILFEIIDTRYLDIHIYICRCINYRIRTNIGEELNLANRHAIAKFKSRQYIFSTAYQL